jgi:hypothetical protein
MDCTVSEAIYFYFSKIIFVKLNSFYYFCTLGTAATVWSVVPEPDDRIVMIVEQSVECEL